MGCPCRAGEDAIGGGAPGGCGDERHEGGHPVSKRRFKATKIQDVRLDDLLKAAIGLRLVVGIDVAKREQFAAIREYRGEPEETLILVSWKHPEETTQFIELCRALAGVAPLVETVMERRAPTATRFAMS